MDSRIADPLPRSEWKSWKSHEWGLTFLNTQQGRNGGYERMGCISFGTGLVGMGGRLPIEQGVQVVRREPGPSGVDGVGDGEVDPSLAGRFPRGRVSWPVCQVSCAAGGRGCQFKCIIIQRCPSHFRPAKHRTFLNAKCFGGASLCGFAKSIATPETL